MGLHTDEESGLGTGSGSTGSQTQKGVPTPTPQPGAIKRTNTKAEQFSGLVQKASLKELFPDPIFGEKKVYGSARFGPIRATFIRFFTLIDISSVRKAHWNINCWTDDEVMAWKSAHVSNCQAIAVASAIFATLGLSAFTLPDVVATHWTARAFLCASMICGVLSVAMASSQQQHVSMLNSALEVRLWLSRGHANIEKTKYDYPFDVLPLESSVATLISVQLPKTLLAFGVWLYLTGFGIYLLCTWVWGINSKDLGDRNVFIIFMLSLGLTVIVILSTIYVQHKDQLKTIEDFALSRERDPSKPEQDFIKGELQTQLEDWLKMLQKIKTDPGQQGTRRKLEDELRKMLENWPGQVRKITTGKSSKTDPTSYNRPPTAIVTVLGDSDDPKLLRKSGTVASYTKGKQSLRQHAERLWSALGYRNEREPPEGDKCAEGPTVSVTASGALQESQDLYRAASKPSRSLDLVDTSKPSP